MDISIIIINWNTRDLLLSCLSSIYENISVTIGYEVIVVDNGSTDGSVDAVKKAYPQVIVIENRKNLGFAAANNIALKKITGRYALLLNTDCILTKGSVDELFNFMEAHTDAGLCCGQLLNPDGSKQNSFANFPCLLSYLSNESLLKLVWPSRYPSKYRSYPAPIKVDSCIGACMMIRKKALDEIGAFDEDYFFFFEETDLCYRMKEAGWNIYFVPSARIYHMQGKSVGSGALPRAMFYRSRYIFLKKHYPRKFIIYYIVIFFRLLLNGLINLAGTIISLGLNRSTKDRLVRCAYLILWHIKGCPQLYPDKGGKE